MTSTRKVCLYKNCKREPGSTLFKFPLEKDRFTTWCLNAGVTLYGEVDITEPRYLCEVHFSAKYINKQSRRKMLVHTAVPAKWKSDIRKSEEPQFTIIGEQPDRKRKFRNINLEEIDLTVTEKPVSTPHLVVANAVRRSSSRLLENTSTMSVEAGEDIETQEIDDHIDETSETATKHPKVEIDPIAIVGYEEMEVMEPRRRSKVQYIVVKPKPKVVSNSPRLLNTVHVLNSQLSSAKKVYESFEQLETDDTEEVGDISSTNIEVFEEEEEEKRPDVSLNLNSLKAGKRNETLENYSEFIFSGEKYVQMPKRVFEAEKEKVRKEAERCKQLLRKLKQHLNNMDLD